MESWESFEHDMNNLRKSSATEPAADQTGEINGFFSDADVERILGNGEGPTMRPLNKRLRTQEPDPEERTEPSHPRQVEALREFLKRRIAQGERIDSLIEFSEDLSIAGALREAAAGL